ncbi:MAG: ankyrin repeat domain-containing protein [Actinomycetota bacterium]|nr:ankyrin repeat domain-containing protein [Actinomycetota bacterium]
MLALVRRPAGPDADIDAPGAVIADGPPLADATAFRQWNVAYRLVDRGVQTNLFAAAALGLMDRLEVHYAGGDAPPSDETNRAFWAACHGGRAAAAQYLLDHGAELNWTPPWEPCTPLDAAATSGAVDLIAWLHARGAKTARQLRGD